MLSFTACKHSCTWTLAQCKHSKVLFVGIALVIISETVASDPADLEDYMEILASTWQTDSDNLEML